MENIYTILEKHFQQRTTPEEEKLIGRFKKEYPQEFIVLKNLWHSNAKIEIKNFDAVKAWAKVKRSTEERKTLPLYKTKSIAAIALIFIVGSMLAYFISVKISVKPVMVEVNNQAMQTDTIILADGTTVWLNRNSKLFYPEKFNRKTREVKLEGEAFFEVAKNPDKPFKVETNYSTATVLGTSFNIQADSLQTEVCVATGKINVRSAYTNGDVILFPDDKAIATRVNLVKSQITNPNYLSWKTGVFLFEDTPLPTVVDDLNRYYPKQILLKNEKPELLFSAKFDKAKQEDIIEILKITFNLDIRENINFYEIN